MNLEDSSGGGTHWTAWYKNIYFDSYGLPPPEEFLDKAGLVKYNDLDIQKMLDPPICGHLCIAFLDAMSKGEDFYKFALEIYRL